MAVPSGEQVHPPRRGTRRIAVRRARQDIGAAVAINIAHTRSSGAETEIDRIAPEAKQLLAVASREYEHAIDAWCAGGDIRDAVAVHVPGGFESRAEERSTVSGDLP